MDANWQKNFVDTATASENSVGKSNSRSSSTSGAFNKRDEKGFRAGTPWYTWKGAMPAMLSWLAVLKAKQIRDAKSG